jgi:hypothetical protein
MPAPTGRPPATITLAARRCELRPRPVVLVVAEAQHLDAVAVGRTRLRLGQTDLGELGIGEGHPRDVVGPRLDRQAEERERITSPAW